ncbi:MAG: cysteine--tRNA ligase [Planctomycetes bacterium]|nr:cysteine--tRNA ligase [Planctomycetota bacterium]
MKIRLYNSLTNRLEEFRPLTPGKVLMYHCGPTVYSSPHIGNFRAFLLADLLRRFLEDQGFDVKQVMNITDVGHMTDDDEDQGEDKLQAEARKQKVDPWKIARMYEDEFRDCLDKLDFVMPHALPRATDYIGQMCAMIDTLLEKGYAYQVNGNVYFDISKFPEYGKLSNKVLDELEEGARVEVNTEKRDPRDFALWKVDDKHLMQWDAGFRDGVRGFPGWHIECSAMSGDLLGEQIDIHTGGEDNMFPHHECEIAQSEACTGKPFVGTWLHVKHLMVDGEKMSKSKGNFYTVSDIFGKGYSGHELRYALMRVQYRQSMNFTLASLNEARTAIARVNEARKRLARIAAGVEAGGADDLAARSETAETAFVGALCDDLNTSGALAAVFAFVTEVNKAAPDADGAKRALAAFDRFDRVLGVFGPTPEVGVDSVPQELLELLERRQAARAAKDFATADACRDEISRAGYQVVDTPEGPRLERV